MAQSGAYGSLVCLVALSMAVVGFGAHFESSHLIFKIVLKSMCVFEFLIFNLIVNM